MATAIASQTVSDNEGIELTNSINPASNNFSMASWMYVTTLDSLDNLFGQKGGTGTDRRIIEYNTTVYRTLCGSFQTGGTTAANVWIWVVFTCVGGAGAKTCYINGSSIFGGSSTSGSADGAFVYYEYATGNFGVRGDVVVPMFYEATLSATQVNELMYNPFSVPQSLTWMPNFWSTTFTDLSPSQGGTATSTGTFTTNATNGPPIFLLGGQ